ncbi:SDR family oxidoreductase [Actinomadura rupiterrae]|uniref:SDR family oxidoreductase n=1 Tax=Actinomadura rupiterrae TaxID=559627 RepID=UPI0020A37967|nr:SDR family oxidoreductase [Actinomadura rupiterrae]MCP2338459.1 nucleoside-diphosphate-sugar epimerase [Actinomadura rupiterrae]
MRVFVTGASGFIGSATVRDLLGAGHEVVGLARSDDAAVRVKAAGAEVVRGSLDDLDGLRAAAEAADGVVHLAFIHDFSRYEENVKTDRRAIEAMGEALAGSGRPLVVAAGLAGAPGVVSTEDSRSVPGAFSYARFQNDEATIALAERDVRTSVVRLPPTVHGEGDKGFIPMVIGIARKAGVSGYPGDGANVWPAVHRLDAARLFRLALESAPAGTRLSAVGDQGVPIREIAELIGRHLGVPAASVPPDHFGFLGALLASDIPAYNAKTRALLRWEPTQPGLIADLEAGHYFSPAQP